MSHDRGCSCGKEAWDYADCIESGCQKNNGPIIKQAEKSTTYVCVHSTSDGRNVMLIEGDDMLVRAFSSNLRTASDRYFILGEEVKVTVGIHKTGNIY
jgi:hypothetical protein